MAIFDNILSGVFDAPKKAVETANKSIANTAENFKTPETPLPKQAFEAPKPIAVESPQEKVIAPVTKVFEAPKPIAVEPTQDKVIAPVVTPPPTQKIEGTTEAPEVKVSSLFGDDGEVVSGSREDKKEGVSTEKFFLTNPITGQKETFDDAGKRDKQLKSLQEQQETQKATDLLTKAGEDFVQSSAQFFNDLQDPNIPDPIKKAQTNELITSFGPKNQALTDSMILTLKQNGQDGAGAGNALLFNLARGNSAEMSNIKARLNTESAQRIFNANKYGMEKGLEIRTLVNRENQQKLANTSTLMATALEAGDFDNVQRLANDIGLTNFDTSKLEQMDDVERAKFISGALTDLGFKPEGVRQFSNITGIELDPNDIASLDPATQKIIENRLDSIEQITDPEERKIAMTQLAQEYPEAFGFPGDPAGAVALVGGMDFTNPEANAQAQSDVDRFWQSEAVKDAPNLNGIITAGDKFWEPYSDASIDSQFANSLERNGDMSLEGMEVFGVDSIEDIDTRKEKEAFLSLTKFNNKKKNVSAISKELFENLGQTVAGTDLESWFDGTDATKESVAREWIVDVILGGNYSTDENGNIVPNLQDIAKPWDENASQFEFLTWPRKFDAEGNVLTEGAYDGKEFRDDLSKDSIHNDPGTIAEDEELTRKYLQYRKENPNELNWLEWYDETGGGVNSVEFLETVATSFDDIISQGVEISKDAEQNQFIDAFNFDAIPPEDLFELFQDPKQIEKLRESGFVDISSGELKKIDNADIMVERNLNRNNLKQKDFVIILDGRPFKVSDTRGLGRDSEDPKVIGFFLDEDPSTREEKEF